MDLAEQPALRRGVMKTTKRYFFGLVSSLLLAAGLARAADRFDPMSNSLASDASGSVVRSSPDSASDTSQDCWVDVNSQ
jgi:hypothetical protein